MDSKKLSLEYEIVQHKVLNYTYTDPEKDYSGKPVRYDLAISHNIPKELDTIIIRIRAELRANELTAKEPFILAITTLTKYSVKGLESFMRENVLLLPSDFFNRIVDAALSTTRGLLIGKNFGSIFQNTLIPLLPTNAIRPADEEHLGFFKFKIGEPSNTDLSETIREHGPQ